MTLNPQTEFLSVLAIFAWGAHFKSELRWNSWI